LYLFQLNETQKIPNGIFLQLVKFNFRLFIWGKGYSEIQQKCCLLCKQRVHVRPRKMGSDMDQYGQKLELPSNLNGSIPYHILKIVQYFWCCTRFTDEGTWPTHKTLFHKEYLEMQKMNRYIPLICCIIFWASVVL
jgi:hypothetical protein